MQFLQQIKGTGTTRTIVRPGYRDADDYGFGAMSLTAGPLDAPNSVPTGASTALGFPGTHRWCTSMRDLASPPACHFGLCFCGGRGDTVHIHDA